MRVITAHYRQKHSFLQSMKRLYLDTVEFWPLVFQLLKRDLFASYKKSFLGVAWHFLTPFIGIISWVILNQLGVLNPGELSVPFPIYVLVGSSLWGLFVSFYHSANNTLGAGAGFINQVYYPHYVLLVKEGLLQLIYFAINFAMILLVISTFGYPPSVYTFLLPLFVLPLFLFGAAIGLVTSIIGCFTTDISRLVPSFLGLLMYLTPILYSAADRPLEFQAVLKLNPFTYLACMPRDLILEGVIPSGWPYVVSCVLAIVMFAASFRYFYIAEERVVEKMI